MRLTRLQAGIAAGAIAVIGGATGAWAVTGSSQPAPHRVAIVQRSDSTGSTTTTAPSVPATTTPAPVVAPPSTVPPPPVYTHDDPQPAPAPAAPAPAPQQPVQQQAPVQQQTPTTVASPPTTLPSDGGGQVLCEQQGTTIQQNFQGSCPPGWTFVN